MNKLPLGFTLIELIVVIAIVSILGAFTPSLYESYNNAKLSTTYRKLYQLSQYTRTLAIEENKIISLCGSNDGFTCTRRWRSSNALIFHDQNKNRNFDSDEHLYKTFSLNNKNIDWRGSNRDIMRYHPKGYLMDWGSFVICPNKANSDSIRLVLNRLGRGYQSDISAAEITRRSLCL